MNKKFLIRLAPPLVLAAFAAAPAVAQATLTGNGSPVHWQSNSTRTPTGKSEPNIAWGTLELTSAAGGITCSNAAAGNAINEASGEAHSEVTMFATFNCKAVGGECTPPAEETAVALNLQPGVPSTKGVWPGFSVEEGAPEEGLKFRSETTGIKVAIECWLFGEKVGSLTFTTGPKAVGPEGTNTPAWLNQCCDSNKPSENIFEGSGPTSKTGHLQAEAPAEIPGSTEGTPGVEATAGSFIIKNPGATWGESSKVEETEDNTPTEPCRIKSAVTSPTSFVKLVKSPTEIEMGGPKPALATATVPFEFKCGKFTVVPIEGSTKGKVKVSGYLDGPLPVPHITLGVASAP